MTNVWNNVYNTLDGYFDQGLVLVDELTPLSRRTVIDVPYVSSGLNTAAQFLGDNAGLDILTAKYLVAMLLGYPLALVFRFIPTRAGKNLYSLMAGVILAQFVFGAPWLHAGLSAGAAYFFIVFTKPMTFLDGWRHVLVFLWMMTYMTISHLYRLKTDYLGWSPDFTGPQMLLTIKITAFAYNIYDGTVQRKAYEAKLSNSKASEGAKRLARRRLDLALENIPSPVEFFAWVYHFGTYFAGPAFELRSYQRALSGEAFDVAGHEHKPRNNMRANQPFPWRSALSAAASKFLLSIVCMGVFQGISHFAPFESLVTNENLAKTSFSEVMQRVPWLWFALLGIQCRYFFVWKLTEGAANICGFGFEPRPSVAAARAAGADENEKIGAQLGNADWEGASQVEVLSFQTASNIQAMTRAWNQRTQWWLENYVYTRAPRSFMLNMLTTYFVSAFWHGFYPGYYLFFMSVPLFAQLDKRLRRLFNPLFYVDKNGDPSVESKTPTPGREFVERIYHVLCIVVTILTTDYLVTTFVALDWNKGVDIWRSFHFAPHIGAVGLHILVTVIATLGFLPRIGKQKKE